LIQVPAAPLYCRCPTELAGGIDGTQEGEGTTGLAHCFALINHQPPHCRRPLKFNTQPATLATRDTDEGAGGIKPWRQKGACGLAGAALDLLGEAVNREIKMSGLTARRGEAEAIGKGGPKAGLHLTLIDVIVHQVLTVRSSLPPIAFCGQGERGE